MELAMYVWRMGCRYEIREYTEMIREKLMGIILVEILGMMVVYALKHAVSSQARVGGLAVSAPSFANPSGILRGPPSPPNMGLSALFDICLQV